MNRKKLAEMFGIETREREVTDLQNKVEMLESKVAYYEVTLKDVQSELDFYKLEDEDKVKYLMEDVADIEALYKERISEYEKLIQYAKASIDDVEQRIHRAKNEGRFNAYSEMGIWRLDAMEQGNRLVMDREGNVFELLELEDVTGDAIAQSLDEIEIGDLA